MRTPTIHLNGTSKRMLMEGYEKAYDTIRDAEKALSEIEFNPRDYYVQDPEAWTEARAEMDKLFAALRGIKEELNIIAESIGN